MVHLVKECSRILCVFIVVWLSSCAQPLFAQTDSDAPSGATLDQIWLQPRVSNAAENESWYPGPIQSMRGTINQFDATSLEWVDIGEVIETQIASDRVIWISPAGFDQLEGPMVELYRQGKYAESLGQLRQVLGQRPAVWRQQWITMLAANAAWRSGRSKIALELVSQLDRRPLPPMVTAWLPIAWKRGGQQQDAAREAEARLEDPSEAVRLVAASWLISGPKREQAAGVVKQLTSSQRRDISALAEAVLWRTATPPQVLQYAETWEQKLDRMPLVLQRGPTRALADLWQAAGRSEDAKRLNWAIELTPIHPGLGE